MADMESRIDEPTADTTQGDLEMGDDGVIDLESGATAEVGGAEGEDEGDGLPFQGDEPQIISPRVTFLDYLKSPIVELLVGLAEEQLLLTAHEALLVQSPFFKDACSQFSPDATVSLEPGGWLPTSNMDPLETPDRAR